MLGHKRRWFTGYAVLCYAGHKQKPFHILAASLVPVVTGRLIMLAQAGGAVKFGIFVTNRRDMKFWLEG